MAATLKVSLTQVFFLQRMIANLTDQIRDHGRFTAVGVAVAHRDNPVQLAVSGLRRHKSSMPIQLTDKWHIGSVTKSITATLVGALVDEGAFKFDSLISDLLPDIPMHPMWADCSLEHLLVHAAGLPANFSLKHWKIAPPTNQDLMLVRRKLIIEILTKPPKTAIGSTFFYSNVGYTIIGYIAETRMNSCYEELVKERLFGPCGLDSAGFGPPRGEGPDDQPMGHHAVFTFRKPADPFKGQADNPAIISAAGRAHMNLKDLAAYGCMHLDGELGVDRFLNAATWQRLHKPIMNDYAYGWVNAKCKWAKGSVIWHNGSNKMWYTLLMLIPEMNTVLAFVTNDGAIRKANQAFNQAAEQLILQLD